MHGHSRRAGRQSAHDGGTSLWTGLWPDVLARFGPERALGAALTRWCMDDPKPLVLLIDEIDTLIGDSLISVLRQLRAGYDQRPEGFPQSVVLCGVRDVRDYRIHSSSGERAGDPAAAHSTSGPNRCASGTSRKPRCARCSPSTPRRPGRHSPRRRSRRYGGRRRASRGWSTRCAAAPASTSRRDATARGQSPAGDILDAREHLVQGRQVHLDQLADKLREDRVRRVVEPLLSGGAERESSARDIEYVRDLGLVARDAPLRIANPIYTEVVPPRADAGGAGAAGAGDRVVRRRRAAAWDMPRAARRLPGVLPRSTPSTGWDGSTTPEAGPAASVAGIPAARGEQRWAHRARVRSGQGVAPTCWSCGRGAESGQGRARSRTGTSSSARCCTGAWSGPSRRGFRRPRRTWTVARAGRATWSSSTGAKASGGRRRSSGATRPWTGRTVTVWGM